MAEMRKTNISNKLNHKLQAHDRVSEDNAEENKEKNDCWLKYFAVKGSTMEACRRIVKLGIQPIFTRRTYRSKHKGINAT